MDNLIQVKYKLFLKAHAKINFYKKSWKSDVRVESPNYFRNFAIFYKITQKNEWGSWASQNQKVLMVAEGTKMSPDTEVFYPKWF